MKEYFIDVASELLPHMRLLIEGVISIYEGDAATLPLLAREKDMMVAFDAYNTIGTALYSLQQYILEFQTAYIREGKREAEM